jgi:hypothetical protein
MTQINTRGEGGGSKIFQKFNTYIFWTALYVIFELDEIKQGKTKELFFNYSPLELKWKSLSLKVWKFERLKKILL